MTLDTNGQERLNGEIRRRSRAVGVLPSVEFHVRLMICFLVEYAEDWSSELSYIREDMVLGSLDKSPNLWPKRLTDEIYNSPHFANKR